MLSSFVQRSSPLLNSTFRLFSALQQAATEYPQTIDELDKGAFNVLIGGQDLEADHPGFHDPDYILRRKIIGDHARNYRCGEEIPRIKYTKEEQECWSAIWRKLEPLIRKYACQEYLNAFDQLQKYCGFREDNIPQLSDLSDFIYERSGFRLRPTVGMLQTRNFLGGMAFNTFFCTQYMRHPDQPYYSPEPDVVHEIIGHVPMLADPEFASFSHEIGLATIGATDEQIEQLGACYHYSVEFGLCKQNNERKIYGGAILSSCGEMENCMNNSQVQFRPWEPFHVSKQPCDYTHIQTTYYMADSFADAKDKMVQFAKSLNKPFTVRWNHETQRLEK